MCFGPHPSCLFFLLLLYPHHSYARHAPCLSQDQQLAAQCTVRPDLFFLLRSNLRPPCYCRPSLQVAAATPTTTPSDSLCPASVSRLASTCPSGQVTWTHCSGCLACCVPEGGRCDRGERRCENGLVCQFRGGQPQAEVDGVCAKSPRKNLSPPNYKPCHSLGTFIEICSEFELLEWNRRVIEQNETDQSGLGRRRQKRAAAMPSKINIIMDVKDIPKGAGQPTLEQIASQDTLVGKMVANNPNAVLARTDPKEVDKLSGRVVGEPFSLKEVFAGAGDNKLASVLSRLRGQPMAMSKPKPNPANAKLLKVFNNKKEAKKDLAGRDVPVVTGKLVKGDAGKGPKEIKKDQRIKPDIRVEGFQEEKKKANIAKVEGGEAIKAGKKGDKKNAVIPPATEKSEVVQAGQAMLEGQLTDEFNSSKDLAKIPAPVVAQMSMEKGRVAAEEGPDLVRARLVENPNEVLRDLVGADSGLRPKMVSGQLEAGGQVELRLADPKLAKKFEGKS